MPRGWPTRDSSGKVLNALAKNVPWLMGGAADLAPSTKTRLTFEGAGDFEPADHGGRNMHFGIREHAMAAILNGMALVKVRALRLGLLHLQRLRPRRHPPERPDGNAGHLHLHARFASAWARTGQRTSRSNNWRRCAPIPGLIVLRPADANEVVEAWKVIMKLHHEPAVLVLTRQALPTIDRKKYAPASGLARGAYVLADAPDGKPDVLLLATGSEVSLCLEAHEQLMKEGIKARVVSMPSWELFDDQPQEYRDRVLPPAVTARVSVEKASTFGWARYVGASGHSIGMRSFRRSAPLKDLIKKFGFTPEHVVAVAKEQLAMLPR